MKTVDGIHKRQIDDCEVVLKIRGIDLSEYIEDILNPKPHIIHKLENIGDIGQSVKILGRKHKLRLNALLTQHKDEVMDILRQDIIIVDGKAYGDYTYILEVCEDVKATIGNFYDY